MPEITTRNYDVKAVKRSLAADYQSFGWIRSKEPVPEEMKFKSKEPLVLLKRKYDFGANPRLSSYEKEYEKIRKKKYRSKPLLGIIAFILMLAFLLVSGVELYYGISSGLDKMNAEKENEGTQDEETAANAAAENDEANAPETDDDEDGENSEEKTGVLGQVKDILDKVKADYLSKVTGLIDGKTDEATGEYTPGIADKLGDAIGAPISYFLSADTLVGVVALILGIIFLILFAEVCKMKKKREKRDSKLLGIRENAEVIVTNMRVSDPTLMGKLQRKQYMWESIITNAIRNANGSGDDEDDDY